MQLTAARGGSCGNDGSVAVEGGPSLEEVLREHPLEEEEGPGTNSSVERRSDQSHYSLLTLFEFVDH